jgi:hypothetical protein
MTVNEYIDRESILGKLTLALPMLVRSDRVDVKSANDTKNGLARRRLTQERHEIQESQPRNDHEVEAANKLLVLRSPSAIVRFRDHCI